MTANVTQKRDTLARARLPFGEDVTVSRRDSFGRDAVHGRDSDTPGPGGRGVTITPQMRKRWSAWIAGAPADVASVTDAAGKVAPINDDLIDPAASARMADGPSDPRADLAVLERQELTRLCAARVMRNHGNGVPIDPETLRWAQWITDHIKPLGRPLTTGDYSK